jgi:hypothetical protein
MGFAALNPSYKIGERTVISYLVKPLRDQLMRTFRERG